MKYYFVFCVFGVLLSLLGCKKDSGIVQSPDLPDFSDVYRLEGNMTVLSNPAEEIPFAWVVSSTDLGAGYQVRTDARQGNTGNLWTIGDIFRGFPGNCQFRMIMYGDALSGGNSSAAPWTVNELDSIFQPGRQLTFGNEFGQVGVEFAPSDGPPGEYWSLDVDNTEYKVTIEEVNDLEIYLPERKWAKQLVLNFDVQLKRVYVDGSPNILLKNCRASVFYSPDVE